MNSTFHSGEPTGGASPADPGHARLIISRNAPDDIQDRWLRMYLDGDFWAMLRYGETLERSLPAGSHTLKAHNTLHRDTLAFEAKPGEEIRVHCTNTFAGGSIAMLLVMVLGVAPMRVRLVRAEVEVR